MNRPLFEDAPYEGDPDETDVNLRAYFDAMDDERLGEVDLSWSDERLREWDGNFRSDGALMMVCCDRDVRVGEYRKVLAVFLQFRSGAPRTCDRLSRVGQEGPNLEKDVTAQVGLHHSGQNKR